MRLALACPLLPTICTSISSLRSMSSPPTPLLKVLCIVYVSESRPAVIQQLLEHASSTGGARLVHSFSDVFYNRTSFYFAAAIQHSASSSSSGSSFLEGLLSFVSKSYAVVDRIDVANHPNIGMHLHIHISQANPTRPLRSYRCKGIVDNVIFSPLGPEPDSSSSSSAEGAYAVICPLADALARGVADAHGVMAFRYGRGRQQRLLRDIRKSLGYFGTTTTTSGSSGSGSGYSSVMRMTAAQALEVVPDAVPDAESLSEAFERRGRPTGRPAIHRPIYTPPPQSHLNPPLY